MCPPTDLNYNPVTNQTTLGFVNSIFGSNTGITKSLNNSAQNFLNANQNYGIVMNLIYKINPVFSNMSLVYFES
jgi:hypothetical protein